ncbi:GNAT family N-acetyltransferase [Streptomyces sp. Caat 7-52]|uniref:GNAT family N-acetyltransferase n=1 Tax=Streptomyces sp. Caat 7-52 TaxID=2949637 RepID=UPI0020362249|nr:GNAT family N-acetyltransferase [Streptomyces sp. Caat 7-52]
MPALRPSVRVRIIAKQDLSDLAGLDHEVFPDDPYPVSVLRQFMDTFAGHLLVAEDNGGLCGYVLATPPNAGESWIFSLGVAPTSRRQGLGRQLMSETLMRLRAEGTRTVLLWVEPRNARAVTLYESFGFVPDPAGPRKNHFGPGEHRLLMTLTL